MIWRLPKFILKTIHDTWKNLNDNRYNELTVDIQTCNVYAPTNTQIIFSLQYLDWATTPTTSAYRSATMCILPVLGPRYLKKTKKRISTVYSAMKYNTKLFVLLHVVFLPFLIFEVLEGQVYYFLDQSIQKRMKGDLGWEKKKVIFCIFVNSDGYKHLIKTIRYILAKISYLANYILKYYTIIKTLYLPRVKPTFYHLIIYLIFS